MLCIAMTNTRARATALTNTSTRVSHTCDHICHVSMFYDVISRCKHIITFFGVPVTWCANAYNKENLAGDTWYARFWCL